MLIHVGGYLYQYMYMLYWISNIKYYIILYYIKLYIFILGILSCLYVCIHADIFGLILITVYIYSYMYIYISWLYIERERKQSYIEMARETFREADVWYVAMRKRPLIICQVLTSTRESDVILICNFRPNIWVQGTDAAHYTFHCPLLVACSSSLLSVCLACSISFSESASYPFCRDPETEFIKVSTIPHVEIRAQYKHCPFLA